MFLVRHIYRRLIAYVVGVLLIGLVVGSHEVGHWIAARGCGIYCPSLNIGIGPGVRLGKVEETEIIVRSLPLGGWVSLASKPSEVDPTSQSKRSLSEQSRGEKLLVSLAGILMNGMMYLGLVTWRRYHRPHAKSQVQLEEEAAWKLAETEADFRNETIQRLADGPASALQFLSRGAMFGVRAIRADLITVSSCMVVINLIPLAPLDGVRIIQALTSTSATVTTGNASSASVTFDTLMALVVMGYVALGILPAMIRTVRFERRLYARFKRIPRS
jgi:membrane-associated protease RseP (regulator of RpoE activity)